MIKNKIVLVPFPFDDFSTTKARPAVCLTNAIGKYQHIIIAFISSKIPEDLLESDLIIRKSDKDFDSTGLTVDSVIRIHKLVTVPKSLISRELGFVSASLSRKISKKIQLLFE